MSHLQTAIFHGNTHVSIITHQNQFWLTAEDAGRCLGYGAGNERTGVIRTFNRHSDEFLPEDTCVVNLTTQGQAREYRVFSKTGCIKLGFFANTKLAKEFRTWSARALAGGNPDAQTISALQTAYLAGNPEMAKLMGYLAMGLTHTEMGKLLDITPTTVRERLKTLNGLGLVDYRPDPKYVHAGKRGLAVMRAKQAFLAQQQPLPLEG